MISRDGGEGGTRGEGREVEGAGGVWGGVAWGRERRNAATRAADVVWNPYEAYANREWFAKALPLYLHAWAY